MVHGPHDANANYTYEAGFHDGDMTYYQENRLVGPTVLRSAAVRNLTYDVTLGQGMEDWDFWLTMLEEGHWGYTVPEHLFWYRGNPKVFREKRWANLFGKYEDEKERIQAKHSRLSFAFPKTQPAKDVSWSPVTWQPPPFDNTLAQPPGQKTALIITAWLFRGGVEMFLANAVRTLSEAGWKVTVACTMSSPPLSTEMRPHIMQYTHDVFTLPNFLHIHDFPRFLSYLVRSRQIGLVFVNNDNLAYNLLPMLRIQHPGVRFADMTHGEDKTWKSGGYPRISAVSSHHLDLSLTNSRYLKRLVQSMRGDDVHGETQTQEAQLTVSAPLDFIYIGVDVNRIARERALAYNPWGSVVMVARFDHGKRNVSLHLWNPRCGGVHVVENSSIVD